MAEAELIPFPSSRRIGFIRKAANDALGVDHDAGDNIIRARIDQQRAAFMRRGFPAAVVEREMRALAAAIHARIWRSVIAGGSVA
jgi:hypothetical protein